MKNQEKRDFIDKRKNESMETNLQKWLSKEKNKW